VSDKEKLCWYPGHTNLVTWTSKNTVQDFKPFDRTLNIKLDILSKWLLFFAHVQANELANKDETKYE
jgi:hypothetical protein